MLNEGFDALQCAFLHIGCLIPLNLRKVWRPLLTSKRLVGRMWWSVPDHPIQHSSGNTVKPDPASQPTKHTARLITETPLLAGELVRERSKFRRGSIRMAYSSTGPHTVSLPPSFSIFAPPSAFLFVFSASPATPVQEPRTSFLLNQLSYQLSLFLDDTLTLCCVRDNNILFPFLFRPSLY